MKKETGDIILEIIKGLMETIQEQEQEIKMLRSANDELYEAKQKLLGKGW